MYDEANRGSHVNQHAKETVTVKESEDNFKKHPTRVVPCLKDIFNYKNHVFACHTDKIKKFLDPESENIK